MSSRRSRGSKKRPRPAKSSSSGRSKARKPKFMNLNDHRREEDPPARAAEAQVVVDDHDSPVACLLEQGAEPDTAATITDLFESSASASPAVEVASPSVEWDGDGLARRALRGRERWVFCRSETAEEVAVPRLQLKLDYEEVITAWSDQGSLYIDGDGPPQVVPELGLPEQVANGHDFIPPTVLTMRIEKVLVGVGNPGGLTTEPEVEAEGKEHKLKREERVMRYKAKRQSRLFAKRIRYEVRKLNAEKRPRIKGRFVKRVGD